MQTIPAMPTGPGRSASSRMLAAYARSQYQEMQVQTTPGKLVVMLYDGALRFLHLGLNALRRGDLEEQGANLSKAQQILFELVSTLPFPHLAVGVRSGETDPTVFERCDLVVDGPSRWAEILTQLAGWADR